MDGAYGKRLTADDVLLLLVDIQEVLLEPCVRRDDVVRNAGVLIEACRVLGIPVVFSEHNPEKLGPFLPSLRAKAPDASVSGKVEFSCLENLGMAETIEKTGRRTILLVGLEAHVCILQTGLHALSLGYGVHAVADAVSSRSEANRELGLRRLDRAGAVISSTEMFIYECLRKAGTPPFRTLLPLLKTLS